ncbi:MAG: TetR/AcrR family transcriptional regulator [Alphaproteobacteria bacterium]|nr:MAG: TetR/AcrR family transcriptional regulator [Alphaproteobacteria bacterium]
MAITDRKEREKEKRRNDIINAAEKLFFLRGYENVTMDDVAKEAELARGTLYLYFKNKDDIYITIAINGSKILNNMFVECCQGAKTGIEKIRSLAFAFYEFSKKYPGYYAAYYYSRMFCFEDFPELGELRRVRMASARMVTDSLHEGIKDGTVRQDIDPLKATLILTSFMTSVLTITPVMEIYLEGNNWTHDEIIGYAIDMIIRSVEKKV